MDSEIMMCSFQVLMSVNGVISRLECLWAPSRTPGIARHRLSSNSLLGTNDLRTDVSLQPMTRNFTDPKSRAGKLLYVKTMEPGKPLSTNRFVNVHLCCGLVEQSVLSLVLFRRRSAAQVCRPRSEVGSHSVVFPGYLVRHPEDIHLDPVLPESPVPPGGPFCHWSQLPVLRTLSGVVDPQDDIMTTLIPVRLMVDCWAIITTESLSVATRRRVLAAELNIPLTGA
ncbi:hypothetical protein EV421DRAFT_1908688 [Armillaria borealis]|uniref:Uncharacterized protein n=1 Tax=Armillaria borealis TaxID=47425 RepID=A0AA39J5Y2_9AGAR|nr:hypothetical protein EV421DRAFT_1908688 [Armillaria borealis]